MCIFRKLFVFLYENRREKCSVALFLRKKNRNKDYYFYECVFIKCVYVRVCAIGKFFFFDDLFSFFHQFFVHFYVSISATTNGSIYRERGKMHQNLFLYSVCDFWVLFWLRESDTVQPLNWVLHLLQGLDIYFTPNANAKKSHIFYS